jgi:D-alanyl-lipoteichoic acid acyltransferase DltB (MBOAT superfamily)
MDLNNMEWNLFGVKLSSKAGDMNISIMDDLVVKRDSVGIFTCNVAIPISNVSNIDDHIMAINNLSWGCLELCIIVSTHIVCNIGEDGGWKRKTNQFAWGFYTVVGLGLIPYLLNDSMNSEDKSLPLF